MKTRLFCCLVLFALLAIPLARAATPAGDRGGSLTAAEEKQQSFLRRLRREIAVQRVLSRQLADQRPFERSTRASLPTVDSALLSRLGATGVSAATLATLNAHPAHKKPEYSHPTGTQPNGKNCSAAVTACFKELERLFRARYGEALTKSPLAAATPTQTEVSPHGS